MARPSPTQLTDVDWICDRCGRFSSADAPCPCRQPYDPVAVRRRYREAVRRAQRTDAAFGRRTRAA